MMETMQKFSIVADAREFFRLLPVDKNIESYKADLIDVMELKKILILCNQFFYITDVCDFSNIYVSDTVAHVLGYSPVEFQNLDFVYANIHPDDMDFVYAFSKKTIAWSRNYTAELLRNPFAAVFSIDYRMKNIQGEYIRVNRQSCCFKTDHLGNMVYAISLFTDIDHIKHTNLITYAWKSEENLDFTIDDLLEEHHQNVLTCRETEIIRHLSQGLSATQIGKKLFISTNTVIKHRKNILHKTGVKNTAELVRYAMEIGMI